MNSLLTFWIKREAAGEIFQIVALFDKDDQYHEHCIEILKGIKEPLITTWPVITEAFYLLNFSSSVQDAANPSIAYDNIVKNPDR